jgi:hypothetical protein
MMMFPNGGGNVFDIAVPRSSAARWGYHYTLNPAAHTNLKTSPVTVGVTVTALTELSGVTRNGASVLAIPTPGAIFSDPWLVFKSRNTVEDGNGTPQQWPYSGSFAGRMSGATFSNTPLVNRYHYFQRQIVRFPPMDYQTWKDVSQSGQQGMHYFKHVAGTSYKEDGAGAAQSFIAWLQQYDRGIFFFDTTNSVKPAANGSNLTPGHAWSPGTYVEGFIYLNSSSFSPTGNGNGSTVACASPGEPFLDDGIDLHPTGQQIGDNCLCMRYDEEEGCVLGARPIRFRLQLGGVSEYCSGIDADDCACPPNVLDTMDNATSQREAETFRNGIWDSDIDNDGTSDAGSDIATLTGWTRWIADNNATAGAGVLRDGHGYRAGALPYYPDGQRGAQGQATDPTPIPNAPFDGLWDWKRDVRFLNNIADFGGTAGDRQPHEPFINFKPSHAAGNVVGDPGNREQQVDWRASGHVVEQNLAGAAVRWTTRSRDATGPMYNLDLAINGVIYIEGLYDGAGNFSVYGSVLAKQGFTANGTPNIWFNEALVKGGFPDPKWKLPRVYSSGRDTN